MQYCLSFNSTKFQASAGKPGIKKNIQLGGVALPWTAIRLGQSILHWDISIESLFYQLYGQRYE